MGEGGPPASGPDYSYRPDIFKQFYSSSLVSSLLCIFLVSSVSSSTVRSTTLSPSARSISLTPWVTLPILLIWETGILMRRPPSVISMIPFVFSNLAEADHLSVSFGHLDIEHSLPPAALGAVAFLGRALSESLFRNHQHALLWIDHIHADQFAAFYVHSPDAAADASERTKLIFLYPDALALAAHEEKIALTVGDHHRDKLVIIVHIDRPDAV